LDDIDNSSDGIPADWDEGDETQKAETSSFDIKNAAQHMMSKHANRNFRNQLS